ncbi:acetyltransferase [Aestuariivirga sp.]|jgi:sugar O-acyltransferase (sialic acid O-acetyltransferase NeuD family)|uniref:acetyltransferase n=1 Tax=Aestuariivirga sp. TaxID=2650926 RepID=UPI00378440CF
MLLMENSGLNRPLQTILFGVRSPIVVEFEEVCTRAGVSIIAAVSVDGSPRLSNRQAVVSLKEIGDQFKGYTFVPVAFYPRRRRALTDLALAKGLTPSPPIIDPSAVIFSSARVHGGSFVNAQAVIGGCSIIGNFCLVNRSTSIGHHTIVEDYVSIGPGVTLASNIRIGEGCVIGAGTTILPNVTIGADSFIAAGSIVRRSVERGMLVSGNPGRAIRPHVHRDNQDE